MRTRYVVTGANGHLGNTLIRMLRGRKAEVYGLVLPNEKCEDKDNIHYIKGDVRNIDSLRPLFETSKSNDSTKEFSRGSRFSLPNFLKMKASHKEYKDIVENTECKEIALCPENVLNEETEIYVIHTAGIIDISEKGSPNLYDVNVNGTKNILKLCKEYNVKRLLYVSSVHAIPEKDGGIISEVSSFSADTVIGAYARTKAEATEAVLKAGREDNLDVVVVQPSGIIGPYDNSGNHLVQMIGDYLKGHLPACVKGGYDFVDVRDVANGCLQALNGGKKNNCYILSNCYYEIKDVLAMVRKCVKVRKLVVLPIWMAKMVAPFIEWIAKLKHERPLYTSYSLHTLKTKDRFTHDKATNDFGYKPRGLTETIQDTVMWFKKTSHLKLVPATVRVRNNKKR